MSHLQGVARGADVVDEVSQQGIALAAVPQQDPRGCFGHLYPQIQDLVQPSPNRTEETGKGRVPHHAASEGWGAGGIPGSSSSRRIRLWEKGCPTQGQNKGPSKGGWPGTVGAQGPRLLQTRINPCEVGHKRGRYRQPAPETFHHQPVRPLQPRGGQILASPPHVQHLGKEATEGSPKPHQARTATAEGRREAACFEDLA